MIFTGLKCVYAWGVGWGALLVCLPAFAQSPVVPEPEGDRVIRTVTLTSAVAGAPGSSFARNHIGPAQQATRTARRLEFKGREPSASVRFRGTDGLPDSERVPDYLVGESLRSIVFDIARRMWDAAANAEDGREAETWPEEWTTAIQVPLWKKKGKRSDKNTWRGITLLSVGTKLLVR